MNNVKFAVTHINRDGHRMLTRDNQGRNHFNSLEECQKWCDGVSSGVNSQSSLDQVFGKQARGTFEPRAVECYPSGDAKGIFYDCKPDLNPPKSPGA